MGGSPPNGPAPSESSRTTVVVITRNRQDELHRSLSQIAILPEQPPVIVVDNCSTDDTTRSTRARFPAVQVLRLSSNLGAAARTVGARLASTPYVAFCDDDSWWEPGALTLTADWLDADPRLGLVAGHVLVGQHDTDDPTSARMAEGRRDEWLRRTPVGRRAVTGFLACAAVVRRSAFLAVGGFDAQLGLGAEEELVALDLAEAGWKLVYAPTAIVHHHPSARRDVRLRRRLLLRNRLLTTLLRYSPTTVARRWSQLAGASRAQPATWSGLAAAAAGAPWALAHRRVVSPAVESAFLELASTGEKPGHET